jgi:hypothetical protein
VWHQQSCESTTTCSAFILPPHLKKSFEHFEAPAADGEEVLAVAAVQMKTGWVQTVWSMMRELAHIQILNPSR